VNSCRARIQDPSPGIEFAQGKEKGITTAVALAALGAVFAIALVAVWLALRAPRGSGATEILGRLAGLDQRLTEVLRPHAATEAALGRAIGETLDLGEVLQRTLAATKALEAVDGGHVSVPLADGTVLTETLGAVTAPAGALAGPPDGSPFVHGIVSWQPVGAEALRSGLVVPLGPGSLSVYSSLANAFDAEAAATLAAIARRAGPAVMNALAYRKLQEEAATDPLTGLGSARAFAVEVPRAIETAHRYTRPLCLIQIDLDNFGLVNKRFGQHAGDSTLAELGKRLRATIRGSDAAFRNSGGADEFFLLLPDTARDDAKRLYARIVFEIEAAPFPAVEKVTLTSGLVQLRPEENGEGLLRRADDLIRRGKRQGRDQLNVDDG